MISRACSTNSAGMGRIDTTSGPANSPAGTHWRSVTYMGTLQPCSMWRTGSPARIRAASKLKLQPSSTDTRSFRHQPMASVAESAWTPSTNNRYRGTSVRRSLPGAERTASMPCSTTSTMGHGLGLRPAKATKSEATARGNTTRLACTQPGAR